MKYTSDETEVTTAVKKLCKLRILLLVLPLALLCCAMCVSAGAEVEIFFGEEIIPMYGQASLDTASVSSGGKIDPELLEYFIDQHRALADTIPIYEAGYRIELTRSDALQYARTYSAPDLFYVSNSYGYSYATVGDEVYLYAIYPRYTMTGTALTQAKAEYESMIESITAQAEHLGSELEIALFYHDFIVANYQYDTDYNIYDAYNLMKQKKGVCQAYTLLYTELLCRSGIKCDSIVSDGLNHVWNALEIDGEWYLADLTWDDPLYEERGRVYHDYFLRSAGTFGHTLSDGTCDWFVASGNSLTFSDTYDSAFWVQEYRWIHPYEGKAYYVQNDTKTGKWYIYSYDLALGTVSTVREISPIIYSTDGWYSTGELGFCGYGDRLYYVQSRALGISDVYEYEIETGKCELVYTHTHTCTEACDQYCLTSIYELFSDGGVIYYLESGAYSRDKGTVGSFSVDVYTYTPDMDLDGDGSIGNSDITVLVRYLSGWSTAGFDVSVADIDGDGKTGNRDVIAIIRYLAFS